MKFKIRKATGRNDWYVVADGVDLNSTYYVQNNGTIAASPCLYQYYDWAAVALGRYTQKQELLCNSCTLFGQEGCVYTRDYTNGDHSAMNCDDYDPRKTPSLVEGKPTNPKDAQQYGHPRFYEMLKQMYELHSRKNHDYTGTSDPLKNLRACERLKVKPFMGVMIRLQDKWSRLEEFVKSGQLMVKNESVIDTLMDNAVYSILAIILYEEQQKNETS